MSPKVPGVWSPTQIQNHLDTVQLWSHLLSDRLGLHTPAIMGTYLQQVVAIGVGEQWSSQALWEHLPDSSASSLQSRRCRQAAGAGESAPV